MINEKDWKYNEHIAKELKEMVEKSTIEKFLKFKKEYPRDEESEKKYMSSVCSCYAPL